MEAALASWLLLPSTKLAKEKSAFSRAPTTRPSTRRTCAGSAAGAPRSGPPREPPSTVTMGTPPEFSSRSTPPMRGSRFSLIQSSTKRLGARSLSAPLPSMACSGRTQVLNCCCGSSASNAPMQRVQRDASTRVASTRFRMQGEEKVAKSIPIGWRAEDFQKGRCIDTLTLNGLALPPFLSVPRIAPRSPGYEAYLSTEQSASQAHPWVPCAHGHQDRPQGARAAPRQGSAQADTLGPTRGALSRCSAPPILKDLSLRARCQGGSHCRRGFASGASGISTPPT